MRVLLLFIAFYSTASFGLDLATYGKKKITDKDLKSTLERLGPRAAMIKTNPAQQKDLVNNIINRNLISDAAMAAKLENTPGFKKVLEQMKLDALASYYLDQKIAEKTKDSELKAYFKKHKDEFKGKEKEVRASHILFKEDKKADAEKILKLALKPKADFAALAKKHSTGPSGPNGGDLNFFSRKRMVKPFSDAAFATKKGKVHPKLVKSQFGWHIIKVTDIKEAGKTTFADVKDQVKRKVTGEVQKEVIDKLRSKAKVTLNEANFKKLKL